MTTQLIFFCKDFTLTVFLKRHGNMEWPIKAIIRLVSTLNWPYSDHVITENDSQKKQKTEKYAIHSVTLPSRKNYFS